MGRTRAIIEDAKFPKELWAEIATTVVYLKNRSPTVALDNITPYEAWYGEKPDLHHLRILGCTTYVHVPEEKRVKLDSHTLKGQLIGYGTATNHWKVWIPEHGDVIVSRDVKFDESRSEILAIPAESAKPIIHDTIEVLQGPPNQYPTIPGTVRSPPPSPEPTERGHESSDESESEYGDTSMQEFPLRVSQRAGKGQHSVRYGHMAQLARTSNPDDEPEPIRKQQLIRHMASSGRRSS